MMTIILLTLFVGLFGIYLSLQKHNNIGIFLGITISIFSSFLFSIFVYQENSRNLGQFGDVVFTKISEIKTVTSTKITLTPPENPQPDLCTQPPTPTDMGSDVYPIDPKYQNLGFLGQIFTAEKCGNERMQKIDGVKGLNYILGSNITLKAAPSTPLLNTLQALGFVCYYNSPDIKTCTEWKTNKTVLIQDLLKLEPFYKEFRSDDCVNCG